MNRKLLATFLLIAAAVLGYATWSLTPHGKESASGGTSKTSLTVFCAAGLKKPVEAIAQQYREEFGIEVSLQYGGTGTLLTQLQVAKQGDLFIAADDGSLADARKRNLVEEVLPLVVQHPVVAVKKTNPKGIHTLADLMREDVKIGLANPDSASISKITREALGAQWQGLAAKAMVMKSTVTEIAADAQLGAVDAAIIWDSTVPQFKDLETVELPELAKHRENASAGVLTFCKQPQEALKFARFLAAPDRGGKVFQQHGFQLAGGDKWAVKPEMVLFSGGVNRLAIEKILHEFADREGVSVTTVFNGCGVLCASMKAMNGTSNPNFPDAYYACDVCFVPPVAEHFPEAVLLTQTEIVIAVPKGNVKKVKTLADLAQPGLRVGLCNAEQSTLGFMTRAMLRSSGLLESVMANTLSQVPTADALINQMRVGSLDAAIVYKVNVLPQAEHFDIIPLPADKAKAVQPFAVRNDSTNRQLSGRLLAYLKNHKESFEAAGFTWRGDEKATPSGQLEIPEWLKGAGK
jgi:molybdenum ABC transporter molybdate-binding protein